MTRKLLFSAGSRFALLSLLFLGVVILGFGGRSVSGADSVPDWLAAAGRVDLGHFGDGSAAVVIGQWTDFTVDATGKFVMTKRRAVRVLNRRSAEDSLAAGGEENSDQKVTSVQTSPYAAMLTGSDLIMPQQFLQAAPLSAIIARHRPTLSAGVPTIWSDLLRYAQTHEVDLSSLRMITAGGAAVPRQLIERFRDELGVQLVQGWGMTETSPVAALAFPPREAAPEDEMKWRSMSGRVVAGVEVRVVGEDGGILPNDGESVGEFEVRGPWITGSYYLDPTPERFHDGWLRTGDLGSLDRIGFMQISDRTKDVIKSGGEWISSVELENEVMAHPEVVEAAVIAVPDERWSERPMVAVVLEEGSTATPHELREFLTGRVSRWWLPERWAIVDEVPKTSVGKFDKKVLRSRYADGGLEVVEIVDVAEPAPASPEVAPPTGD